MLLSGGLDSSLVAAIAARKIKREGSVWGKQLHSFCVGLEGSPDLKVQGCGVGLTGAGSLPGGLRNRKFADGRRCQEATLNRDLVNGRHRGDIGSLAVPMAAAQLGGRRWESTVLAGTHVCETAITGTRQSTCCGK